jgi:hypothetical protein
MMSVPFLRRSELLYPGELSRQLGGFMDQDRQMLRANPESLILVL